MAILKVANVHFSNTTTIRVEHINNDNVLRLHANSMILPVGTTTNRPGTPSAGMIRYNSTLGQFEGYNTSSWGAIGGVVDLSPSFVKANIASETANAAFVHANGASLTSNASFIKANTSNAIAFWSFDQANTGYAQANLVMGRSNTAHGQANSGYTQANLVYGHANAAFARANAIPAGPTTFSSATFNNHTTIDYNVVSPPGNYFSGTQLEVKATSGVAGIGLHRSGYSHCGIYHDQTDTCKFNFNSGTVTMNYNTGVIWGNGNDGAGSGLDADTVDGIHSSSFAQWSGGTFTGNIYAPVFYDQQDPGNYWMDMNGTSYVNDFRPNIMYLRQDTNNFFRQNEIGLRGNSPTIYFRDTDQLGSALHNNSNIFYILRMNIDSGSWTQYNGQWPVTVNLTNNDCTVGGTFYSIYNVVAYASDERLKENLRKISTPLQKIQQLNGYIFDWKQKANDEGFYPDLMKDDCGLLAQEVQKIVPQAVVGAGFDREWNNDTNSYKSKSGEDYLTVQYEKLVPLLIEAIKELSKEVEDLKSKLK